MTKELINYIQTELLGNPSDFQLSAEDDLLTSGLVESIGMMKLIGFIEKTWDTKIPPQDMLIENFISVNAICQYLENRG
jgi:acyl carrier protein